MGATKEMKKVGIAVVSFLLAGQIFPSPSFAAILRSVLPTTHRQTQTQTATISATSTSSTTSTASPTSSTTTTTSNEWMANSTPLSKATSQSSTTSQVASSTSVTPTSAPIPTTSPSTTLTAADITNLPGSPQITRVAPQGNTTAVSSTQRGVSLNYNTAVGGWAGGGFTFDDFSTSAIETQNLTGLSQLVFGLKGNVSQVKFEIIDNLDHKVSIYLTGIRSDTEQVWAVPTSQLTGVDLTKTRLLYFIVEGANQTGTLEVNRVPTASTPASIAPSTSFTTANITNLPGSPQITRVAPQGIDLVKDAPYKAVAVNPTSAGWWGKNLTVTSEGHVGYALSAEPPANSVGNNFSIPIKMNNISELFVRVQGDVSANYNLVLVGRNGTTGTLGALLIQPIHITGQGLQTLEIPIPQWLSTGNYQVEGFNLSGGSNPAIHLEISDVIFVPRSIPATLPQGNTTAVSSTQRGM